MTIQQATYYPLSGGLDITTPGISANPGTARVALNYESDITGYRRMTGYERFDGRTSPTDAFTAASDDVQGAIDRDAARAAITAVPGQGPVRGIWYYNGKTYAFRDNIGATQGRMFEATSAGWVLVSSAFAPGGHYEFVNYNFTGAAGTLKMYGANGVNKAFQFDGTTVTFITTGMASDLPVKIAAHKKHLFLSFVGGSVQHSALGDPLTWTAITGAAEMAVGDEVTDLISSAPDNLAILAKNSITMVYGNDASDWQLTTITNEAGAIPHTAEKFGPIVYMDNRGIRSMQTTASFGNFQIGTMTQQVSPLLRTKLAAGDLPVASCRVRAKDIYRVFWSDGYGLSVFMGKKKPEVMPIDLGITITCIASVETSDTSEKIWFGSENGFVYQMDKGRSFDGEVVGYYLRLPFHHIGSPSMLKRWHRLAVEYDSGGTFTLRISGEVDNADPDEPSLIEQNATGYGGGAFWGSGLWDQFYWSAPVDGDLTAYIDAVGKNMSLLFGGEEADEEPHILQGLTLYYSVRGMLR